jgi:hypothetical protein
MMRAPEVSVMRAAMKVLGLSMLFVTAGSAAYAQGDDREAQHRKDDLERLAREMPVVAADPGRDAAPVRSPPWCDAVKPSGSYGPSAIARSFKQAQHDGWGGYLETAMITCFFPNEPAVQKATAAIEQAWINLTGLSEPEALETFKARLAADTYKADKEKLCDQLTVSEEVQGEELSFMTARRALFGCTKKGWADKYPLWADNGTHVPDDLVTYVDASSIPVDEVVRLALISDHVRFVFGEHNEYYAQRLLSYVTDQFDYLAFTPATVMKVLDAAPYQNNAYARGVLLESIGRAKLGILAITDDVNKKAADADWKELLVLAPQRGIADWTKEMTKWKDVFARSNAFEHAFWGPSRKAMKGCWPALYKDFNTVAKTLKHTSAHEFKEALSDPIASLLFSRLGACAAVDGDGNYAMALLTVSRDLRASRGPRLAAYYAALDALSKILEDRTKFPVDAKSFWFMKSNALYTASFSAANGRKKGVGFVAQSAKGIVKSASKGANGVVVQFQTEKHQEMGRTCVETGHILTFRTDGSPLYYQKCHDTGLITVNDTPGAVTIPADWATGIVAGAALEFEAAIGPPPARLALPKAVYSDKSKKKLVNFYGLGL